MPFPSLKETPGGTFVPPGALFSVGLEAYVSGQSAAVRPWIQLPVRLKVELAARPKKITASTITAAMRATMTAYSTAVAPRSLRMFARATTH
jgi:hypothetical protein